MVAEIGAQRLDPVALARRLRADRARVLERLPGGLRGRPRRRADQRIAEQVERDAPVGDGATRVPLQHALERLARVTEPVRVQHREAALEFGLYLRVARGREAHFAELLVLLGQRTAAQGSADQAYDNRQAP